MPILPLQNTISCSAQEDSATKCLDRYMLVNTEAYALSYKFSGDFGIVESEPSNITKLCFCKNNKRTIIIIMQSLQAHYLNNQTACLSASMLVALAICF
jgi:hypothetical protein